MTTTKSFLVLPDGDEDNPSIAIQGTNARMGFFVNDPLSGITQMQLTNGDDNVASWSTADDSFSVPNKLTLGGTLQAGGGTGTSGQVLASTGNGVEWISTSGHSHTGISFPNSGTLLSNNNHNHSGLATENYVNTRGFGTGNSNLTNANVDTSHGTHGGGLSNSHVNSANAHGQSNITGLVLALSAKKGLNALPNNHDNNEHNVSFVTSSHFHINQQAHDSRMLKVNSNTVPGINVVKRMNPVTANFTNAYGDVISNYTSSVPEVLQDRYRLTYQDVKQAFIDDGHDPSNIAYFVEDLDYVEEEAKADLPEGETMKGLMDGELEPVLVKSIQDLYDMIELLQARVDELEGA